MAKQLFKYLILVLFPIFSICLSSCGDDNKDEPDPDPSELIIGKWVCYNDAYGYPWDEPLVYLFDADGTGYGWFQEEPFSYRWEFTYSVTQSKIHFAEYDDYYDEWDRYDLRYEISANGKSLVLYGYDDNDMSELHFIKM